MDDIRNYEIHVLDGERQLLYLMPTGRSTKQAAKIKAFELLSCYGGESFTLESYSPATRSIGSMTTGNPHPRSVSAGTFRPFGGWSKVVVPQRQERFVWLGFYLLVLLAIANVWVTRATAESATPSYATSATSTRKTIRVATFHPDLRASMLSAASPF
jgi:hypothetical protein